VREARLFSHAGCLEIQNDLAIRAVRSYHPRLAERVRGSHIEPTASAIPYRRGFFMRCVLEAVTINYGNELSFLAASPSMVSDTPLKIMSMPMNSPMIHEPDTGQLLKMTKPNSKLTMPCKKSQTRFW
jgi:hypothetical protein